ncbi:hypothetical protein BOTCAL_0062g00030 [Botryotinia calthae]|uniref:Yippee domain-containing protein n=1 Tax=Botryotinia calthae TaxID=38488 RepID=A0A4Y8DA62_9HELO|nr:hypothetical protein BOTCAL_0062g00030 [Botryotinia calthae]
MSSEAEVIICYCLKCGLEVGSFDNSWEGLGKTYYIPKVIRDATGLKGIGSIKLAVGPAQVGTIIENSSLQDLACANCREVFGLLCDNAPEGHLLQKYERFTFMKIMSMLIANRGQLLICAKKVSMKLQQTGEKAILSVTKTHDLKKSSNNLSSQSRRPSSILPKTPAPGEISYQSIEKPSTPAAFSPLVLGDAKIMLTICEQRKDIDRIDAAVGRLENDMQDVKIFMKNMRRDMTAIQNARSVAASVDETLQHDLIRVTEKADGVNNLRTELYSLRTRVGKMERGSRKALNSDARVITTPAPSDELQEGQVLPKLISNERSSQLNNARDLSMFEGSRSLHRKRRYTEAEYDQVDVETSKFTEFGKYKRRKETEAQQDEDARSLSIPPTRSPSKEPTSPSNPRIESPILGRYDTNGDVNCAKQDVNIQYIEQDTERQIPESPSQQIETEMNTPGESDNFDEQQNLQIMSKATGISSSNKSKNDEERRHLQNNSKATQTKNTVEHNNNEEHQNLLHVSQATSNTLPESSQAISPAQPLNISPANSNEDSFTSHSDQPQNHHRSRKQIEIPNSSQSEFSQNTQEQQLPSNSRRGPGRPKGTPYKQNRSAANTPHTAQGPGRPKGTSKKGKQAPQSSTPQSNPRRGRPKGALSKSLITSGTLSNGLSSEESSTPGRALRGRILPVPNSSPLVREVASIQSNLVIDLTYGNERGGFEPPGEIIESPMQNLQPQKDHVSVPLNIEKDNPSHPAKRQRRNTRNSRQRPSVDLDKALAARLESGNATSDEAVESDYMDIGEERQAGSRSRRSKGFKGSPADDDTYTLTRREKYYDSLKRKRAQSEQSIKEDRNGGKENKNGNRQDSEQEREEKRGRERERPKEQERERRKSTRRREVERREELVKEVLERE